MLPNPGQIATASYHRWERRGHAHGRHREDWLMTEQELLFGLNYEVLGRHRLDGVGPQTIGDPGSPRCRFCEQSAPRTSFTGPRLAIPGSLGNQALLSVEDCDDCHSVFAEGLSEHLDRFLDAVRRGDPSPARSCEPVAAFKGLARAALALLPSEDLQFFEDAIEWVGNPDHDLDSRSIGLLECVVHTLPESTAFSWSALARRVDDDAPMPYILGFFATGPHVFQVPIPLATRDEDLEGSPSLPRVASPFGVGRGPLDFGSEVISFSSPAPARERRRVFLGR